MPTLPVRLNGPGAELEASIKTDGGLQMEEIDGYRAGLEAVTLRLIAVTATPLIVQCRHDETVGSAGAQLERGAYRCPTSPLRSACTVAPCTAG